MILQIATSAAAAAGFGLAGVGLFMALAPRKALTVLAAMGGTPGIHFGEMAVRALVGAALIVAGPASRLDDILPLIGWFLLVSAAVLAVLPRRWHATYSQWWSARMPVWAFRLSGVVGVAAGVGLAWACL